VELCKCLKISRFALAIALLGTMTYGGTADALDLSPVQHNNPNEVHLPPPPPPAPPQSHFGGAVVPTPSGGAAGGFVYTSPSGSTTVTGQAAIDGRGGGSAGISVTTPMPGGR
jgi:hypothetical protein